MPIMMTWNMQGGQGNYGSKWTSLSGTIGNPISHDLQEAPSIIFLQECSDVPGLIHPAGWAAIPGAPANLTLGSKNFGTQNDPKCYFVAHYLWGQQNNRVSFAVLIRTDAHLVGGQKVSENLSANVVIHNPVAGAAGTRPIIGVTVGTATYYTMHAPSGVAAGFSRTYIDGMINAASAGAANYVIGGDFNIEPADLYNGVHNIPSGQLDPSGHDTYFPNNGATKQYDYFTSNNSAPHHTALEGINVGDLLSDHICVTAAY